MPNYGCNVRLYVQIHTQKKSLKSILWEASIFSQFYSVIHKMGQHPFLPEEGMSLLFPSSFLQGTNNFATICIWERIDIKAYEVVI